MVLRLVYTLNPRSIVLSTYSLYAAFRSLSFRLGESSEKMPKLLESRYWTRQAIADKLRMIKHESAKHHEHCVNLTRVS